MIASKNFLLLIIYLVTQSHAFTSQITKLRYPSCGSKLRTTLRRPVSVASSMTMRDASASYWFRVGDCVRVVDDVPKAGVNLRNRVGKVIQTWEKCDVDPTCCCAEMVDLGMAVRVEFCGTEADENDVNTSFYHYFAEEEILHVNETG